VGKRRVVRRTPLTLAAAVLLGPTLLGAAEGGGSRAQTQASPGPRDADSSWQTVEVRSYNLKAGTRDRFHERVLSEALPLLERYRMDVVAHGPSLHDRDSYFLIRAFSSLEDRQRGEDAFYGSDDWKSGPREAILADIESYTTVVVQLDGATVRGLRMMRRQGPARKDGAMASSTSDLPTLLELNRDYIRSVQTGDVQRFKEILADDFLCSLPDGSLIDKGRFLERTAQPVTISDLEVHDVNVRLMDDFAIVHARTTYKGPDGRPGSGRYTDVWARRNGAWVAVSAHVTRN
jgi:hypothetical protein